jgi:hypothetical protein
MIKCAGAAQASGRGGGARDPPPPMCSQEAPANRTPDGEPSGAAAAETRQFVCIIHLASPELHAVRPPGRPRRFDWSDSADATEPGAYLKYAPASPL